MSSRDYVIVEFNPPPRTPRVATTEVFTDLEEASTEASHLQNAANEIGGGTSFTVAALSYRDENY